MTKTTTTCDHCGAELPSELRSFFGGPNNSLAVKGMQIALAIDGEARRTQRDLCNEHCLRDFLVKHLPTNS